jgi:hypothetical protein
VVDARIAGEATSPNLGVITGIRTLNNLALQDTEDWFKFQTAGVGTSAHSVRIDYEVDNGNLNYVQWRYVSYAG